MKKKWLVIATIIWATSLYAQDWQKEVGDEWFNKHQGLNVGDKMPDISLGTVINNYTGKEKFSDFKGKLVILDFWSTNCSACMAAFPKMEKLQKQFGDQIQIFIVNSLQTQQDIDKWFTSSRSKKYKLPDLPSIVGATELRKLFPMRFVPHHVWINKDGIICVRGSAMNTNEDKISALLSGQLISYLKDGNTAPDFNEEKPYHTLIGKSSPSEAFRGSFFTHYNNDYATPNGGMIEETIDTTAATIRNTYVNTEVLKLYASAFKMQLEENEKRILNYTTNAFISSSYPLDYFLLYVKDTTQYTSIFTPYLKKTDKVFSKNLFCYEQVTSRNMTREKRRQNMLDDLNQYFGNLYGVKGKLEKKKLNCYVLVRTSNSDKIISKANEDEYGVEEFNEDGKVKMKYKNLTFNRIMRTAIFNNLLSKQLSGYGNGKPVFLIDETGINRKVDMVFPKELQNIDDLKMVLKNYDIDVIPAEREITFVVIKER